MHAIQVRNVPQPTYELIVQQAKRNHRSIANEVLSILEQAVGASSSSAYDYASLHNEIVSVREKIAHVYGSGPSSAALIREDRDR